MNPRFRMQVFKATFLRKGRVTVEFSRDDAIAYATWLLTSENELNMNDRDFCESLCLDAVEFGLCAFHELQHEWPDEYPAAHAKAVEFVNGWWPKDINR